MTINSGEMPVRQEISLLINISPYYCYLCILSSGEISFLLAVGQAFSLGSLGIARGRLRKLKFAQSNRVFKDASRALVTDRYKRPVDFNFRSA